MALSSDGIQRLLAQAILNSPDLASEPTGFVDSALSGHETTCESVKHAVDSIYRRVYYGFVADLDFDAVERNRLVQIRRVLDVDDERAEQMDYTVGLSLYKKAFKEAVSDGEMTQAEMAKLASVASFFGLRKRDTAAAVREQALWYYSFKLSESLTDGVLSEEEMGNLALIARNYGLPNSDLSSISVPEQQEILRAALTEIKAKGRITDRDRKYITCLVGFLNAKELLKPCMLDLDLYEQLFSIRRGELPEIEPGDLYLENGEHLHLRGAAIYERPGGGTIKRQTGVLYVGSVKLRFVGRTRSHELRYGNILEVSFENLKNPRLSVIASSGSGTGGYRFSKSNNPARLLELKEMIGFLIRKARRMIEPRAVATAYIPEGVRSEVYARDGGACVLCGAREYLEFDHIIPRSKGGASTVDNLQILCRKCNSEKADRI